LKANKQKASGLKKNKIGGIKMKKVLKNVEIASKVVEELSKKGYDIGFEKVLNLVDISRTDETEEANINDFVTAFETIEQEKEFNR